MTILFKLKAIFIKCFLGLRWYSVLAIILAYVFASWFLLWLCGESDLTRFDNFLYWLIVTASTVGYGDYSPTTEAGKYVVAFFVIPCGLGVFAWVLGQFASLFTLHWRRGVQGLKQLDNENHILVIGWNGPRTIQLLRLLLREQLDSPDPKSIVLCVMADIENPLPTEVGFVKVRSFTFGEEMERTNLTKASSIIIDNVADDVTMTTALYCYSQNPSAHTIAYFQDEKLGDLLKQHCPNVECMPSVAVEMIAKSAADPGSSALHHQLLAVDEGMTQFSVSYDGETVDCEKLFSILKQKYDITLIGVKPENQHKIVLNPALDYSIEPGATLYYIGRQRIASLNWNEIFAS